MVGGFLDGETDPGRVAGDAATAALGAALLGGAGRVAGRALGVGRAGGAAGAAGAAGRRVGAAGLTAAGLAAFVGEAKRLADQLGRLDDHIQVTVAGNPFSTRRSLYEVAAATAFGMVARLVPAGGPGNPFGPPGVIAVAYDAAANELTFSLQYSRSLATILSPAGAGAGVLAAQPVFGNLPQTITGGDWDARLPTDPVLLPPTPTPDLAFGGRAILTTAAFVPAPNPKPLPVGGPVSTPNPRPAGDARSRGTLSWLVFQTLAAPAESGPHTYTFPPNSLARFSGS
jgi:hypothetical protein